MRILWLTSKLSSAFWFARIIQQSHVLIFIIHFTIVIDFDTHELLCTMNISLNFVNQLQVFLLSLFSCTFHEFHGKETLFHLGSIGYFISQLSQCT
ncbi:hypothetical protein D3C80_1522190 [compost metagenome]